MLHKNICTNTLHTQRGSSPVQKQSEGFDLTKIICIKNEQCTQKLDRNLQVYQLNLFQPHKGSRLTEYRVWCQSHQKGKVCNPSNQILFSSYKGQSFWSLSLTICHKRWNVSSSLSDSGLDSVKAAILLHEYKLTIFSMNTKFSD